MLKITGHHDGTSESMTLTLEGRLAGAWVRELDGYWRGMTVQQQSHAVMDVTGVTFVDADGKELLTRLWREGARFIAAGCLTKCIIEDITTCDRSAVSKRSRKRNQ